MKHAATQELYAYWNDLRGERTSPERGEVDPAAIRGILADTFILEVDAKRRFAFRLSGTRLNALFTADLKGRAFPLLWTPADRLDIVDLLGAVCDDATPILAGVNAAAAGREAIDLELLLLPVRHLGKTHARILGCLSPASMPSWIGLLPLERLFLTALRVLTPTPASLRVPRSTGADEEVGPPRWNSQASTRRGHLFVYEGGR